MTDTTPGPTADAVLAAAATCFPDVPGIEVVDEGDLLRAFAPGRPYVFCNSIARLRLDASGLVERVAEVEGRYRAAELPTSWWVSDATLPADALARLGEVGLRLSGSEAVMVLDLAVDRAGREVPLATVEVTEVATLADLDDWIAVTALSYGWEDAAKASTIRGLYDPTTAHGRSGRRVQFLARIGGRAVGAASLFETAGAGWVTNVGTIPDARGRGVGAAVTLATIRLARERGYPSAWLAASDMGEPVYRRLGFRTVGRLSHLVGPAQQEQHSDRARAEPRVTPGTGCREVRPV